MSTVTVLECENCHATYELGSGSICPRCGGSLYEIPEEELISVEHTSEDHDGFER